MYSDNNEISTINDPEENYKKGYVHTWRSIDNHWIMSNPYYYQAFSRIIMKVNHSDNDYVIEGQLINCKRSQALYSLNSWVDIFNHMLTKKWWTKQKIRTFFNLLKKDSMIEIEGLQKTTRLTLCNYNSYNNTQHTKNIQTTHKKHSNNTQKTSTKELKNEKNDNKTYPNKDYKKSLLVNLKEYNFDTKDLEYYEITMAFFELFRKNLDELGIKTTIIDKAKGNWVDPIRLMIEKKEATHEDLREIFKFLNTNDFWKKNILSTSKLRKQFTRLLMESKQNGRIKRNNKEATSYEELAEILSKHWD